MAVTSARQVASAWLIERSHDLATPFLLLDLSRVRSNLWLLRDAFPRAEIFYALKANPSPEILQVVAAEGGGFEISSDGELDLVESIGRPVRLISSNPIKSPGFIRRAAGAGIREFAVDSSAELTKIAREAPGASV